VLKNLIECGSVGHKVTLNNMENTISVYKFGGSSLATAEHILAAARRVQSCLGAKRKAIVVVSAMGAETDRLYQLARKVAPIPSGRELDMLVSTGERVSMALLSMALNEIGVKAVSFTGSQAGIITSEAHSSAQILEITPVRVLEAFETNRVVVIAGFQGVSKRLKEVTTLGRGGSDLTAVAYSIALKATHCEFMKELPGFFTADPKIVPTAKHVQKIPSALLLECTYWGAKVLHHRCVELAHAQELLLRLSTSHEPGFESGETNSEVFPINYELWGKRVEKGSLPSIDSQKQSNPQGQPLIRSNEMNTNASSLSLSAANVSIEKKEIFAISGFKNALLLKAAAPSISELLEMFSACLGGEEVSWPQLLYVGCDNHAGEIICAGSPDLLRWVEAKIQNLNQLELKDTWHVTPIATVSVSSTASVGTDYIAKLSQQLKDQPKASERILMSPMSATFLVPRDHFEQWTRRLHELSQSF